MLRINEYKKPLTLLCVQPCIPYYAWQIEVMLTNFEQLKLHEDFNIVCLFAYNKNEHNWKDNVSIINKVEFRFSDVANFTIIKILESTQFLIYPQSDLTY